MKPREPLIALMAAVFTMAALLGCASLATKSSNPRPAMTLATTTVAMAVPATTPSPGDQIAARTFIDGNRGWAVGTSTGGGNLIQRTVDGGKHWSVLMRDDHGFPLVGVCFVDELYGWAIASTGTLVGYIIATVDGGISWHEQGTGYDPLFSVRFTDRLHGIIEGMDGNSPNQKPIKLITSHGGKHWVIRPKK